jgi:DNA polymerase III epsilon subunit-like protein
MNVVIFDIETTGLDPEKNSIVSIGAVDPDRPDETFYGECRVFEGAEISPDALKVNGYTVDDITDPKKQTSKELYLKFEEYVKNHKADVLAGFNISKFDLRFIAYTAKRYNLPWNFPTKYIDIKNDFEDLVYNNPRFADLKHQIDTLFPPPTSNHEPEKINFISLNRALKYFGVDDEPRPHNALGGAKYATELYGLFYLKSHFLREYDKYPINVAFKGIEFKPRIVSFNYNDLL